MAISNESIFNSIEEDILILDKNLRIVDANSHALDALNLDRQDVIGKTCYGITHCDPPEGGCPLFEVLKTGEPAMKRCAYLGKSGSRTHKEVAVYPLIEGENTGKFFHIEIYVTEQARSEAETREYVDSLMKRLRETTPDP